MAVCGSRTARPAQVREMARAAAAEVAAVELRVGDGGRPMAGVCAGWVSGRSACLQEFSRHS